MGAAAPKGRLPATPGHATATPMDTAGPMDTASHTDTIAPRATPEPQVTKKTPPGKTPWGEVKQERTPDGEGEQIVSLARHSPYR